MKLWQKLICVVLAVGLVTAVGLPSLLHVRNAAAGGTEEHMDHVFVIMMENHGPETILNPANPATPFLQSLAKNYAVATNYYGVTHPSLPNYVAAISGSTWGSNADDTSQVFDHTNIVDQLEANNLSWKAYMESLPYPGYAGGRYQPPGQAAYAPAHNPFLVFPDIIKNPERANKIVPLTQLSADIATNQVPDYAWITPNICNDMHLGPGCDGVTEDQLEALGDNFAKQWVNATMQSRAWTGNSTIFITFDEGPVGNGCCDSPTTTPNGDLTQATLNGGGLVPMIVISRHGPRGYTDNTASNHYSLLRTVEENWNLGYLANAGDSQQVQSLWPLIDG